MKRSLFLSAVGDKVQLMRQADEIARNFHGQLPGSARLQSIALQYDVNIATLVLEQCLRRDPAHGCFIRQVEEAMTTTTIIQDAPLLVIVPGLYYKEHPELGGDAGIISNIAKKFGLTSEIVPTKSLGSINENSEILHQFLRENHSRPYWLASISRGGAEFKWLLYKYPNADYLDRLQGWVSVNGIVKGTRVFDKVRESGLSRTLFHLLAKLNRIDSRLVDELHHSRTQWAETVLPERIQYINIISLPMSWDITGPVQSRYRQLAHHGPNDGAVILGDYLTEPGLIYPMAGADHLMRKSNLSAVFYKLINHLLVDSPHSPV